LNITATKHIHYTFVFSENNPDSDAVVIWLNGGPGCSSLDGFVYEHGPFMINPANYSQLQRRSIYWSQVANVLYIEAPVGVGFSYSDHPSEYACDDDQTANDNLAAVEKFFELFPSFTSNPFFITGESYAGIYVPTLAEAIMNAAANGSYSGAPLKGIAVGNGCSGSEIGICGFSTQGTYYLYKYLLGKAFISEDLKLSIGDACNWTSAASGGDLSDTCKGYLNDAAKQIGHINLYNVYGDCVGSSSAAVAADGHSTVHAKAPHKTLFGLGGPDACIDSRAASGYLNRPDVVRALNVRATSYEWAVCATPKGWTYNSTRPNLPRDTYPALVKKYRVLIYNGDWDACVPYTDNQAWTEGMGFKVDEDWHPWLYTSEAGLDNQVAGYAVKYTVPDADDDSWFRFITVRGGRHEVPETAPLKALNMLTNLIYDQEF
jgi:carboxypeptidase C (cathepsin A)